MNQVLSAIKSGLQDKAISILKEHDQHLSLNDAKRLLDISFKSDSAQIFSWLRMYSCHRFDFYDMATSRSFFYAFKNDLIEILKLFAFEEKIRIPNLTCFVEDAFINRWRVVDMLVSLRKSQSYAFIQTVFEYACKYEKIDIVKEILFDPEISHRSLNCKVINYHYDNPEFLKLLLSSKIIFSFGDLDAVLQNACNTNSIEIVKMLLLDERIDPINENYKIIKFAILYRYLEIIKILLTDERFDLSGLDNFIIGYAKRNGATQEIIELLENAKHNKHETLMDDEHETPIDDEQEISIDDI